MRRPPILLWLYRSEPSRVIQLVLGLLLLRFGTLRVTILCHALWNTISSLVMFYSGSQG